MAYENVDNIKIPEQTVVMDSLMRNYNYVANQIYQVPTVGINNRFVYSPKTLKLDNSVYGLLDKTPIIPYEYDMVAAYGSLREYQKFPLKTLKRFPDGASVSASTLSDETGATGNVADFGVTYAQVPPPYFRDPFLNGARGKDLDLYVGTVQSYARGDYNVASLWTPLIDSNSDYESNSWKWLDQSYTELGIKCGAVHILKRLNWTGTATDNDHKVYYRLSGAPDDEYFPSTIDGMIDAQRDLQNESFYYKNFNLPALSTGVEDYSIYPWTPNGIIDFRVSFQTNQQYSDYQMIMRAQMPLQVAFSNLTPKPLEIVFFVHPYNYYFRDNEGSFSNASRNPINRSTTDIDVAVGLANSRSPQATFYDFGTGLKAYTDDGSNIAYNYFTLEPHSTSTLIDIDLANVFMKNAETAADWHGWVTGLIEDEGAGEYVIDTKHAYNSGCYGFWIDLRECFFRIKKD